MSMEDPNPMEKTIETYAACVREEYAARRNEAEAPRKHEEARDARQEAWREVKTYIQNGRIAVGVYRINRGPGQYAEALLIDKVHDYPDLLPMFR